MLTLLQESNASLFVALWSVYLLSYRSLHCLTWVAVSPASIQCDNIISLCVADPARSCWLLSPCPPNHLINTILTPIPRESRGSPVGIPCSYCALACVLSWKAAHVSTRACVFFLWTCFFLFWRNIGKAVERVSYGGLNYKVLRENLNLERNTFLMRRGGGAVLSLAAFSVYKAAVAEVCSV